MLSRVNYFVRFDDNYDGRRLRATGVSFEDRQDLLGHRSGRITTYYSAAELSRLIDATNSICEQAKDKPKLVILRRISIN